jgi:hypothetical protein
LEADHEKNIHEKNNQTPVPLLQRRLSYNDVSHPDTGAANGQDLQRRYYKRHRRPSV